MPRFQTVVTLLVLAVAGLRSAHSAERPNILFILADDQSHETLSCYGNAVRQTPNLDRLAKEGIVLDDAAPHGLVERGSLHAVADDDHDGADGLERFPSEGPDSAFRSRFAGSRSAEYGGGLQSGGLRHIPHLQER